MNTDTTNNLVITYKHINTQLSFSDISQIPKAKQAFQLFVSEMTSALEVIQLLRQLLNSARIPQEAKTVEQLFLTVVQTTADYYFSTHAYALRSAKVPQPADGIEAQNLLDFELEAGPYVRELNDSMSILQGYTLHPLQVDRPYLGSVWDPRDWCIDRLIKLLTAYQDHIKGNVNLEKDAIKEQALNHWTSLQKYVANY